MFRLPLPHFEIERWCYQGHLFTSEECQKFVAYASNKESKKAELLDGDSLASLGYRETDLVWIDHEEQEVVSFFEILAFSISCLNWTHLRATLYDHLIEAAQFATYRPGHKFEAHTDRGGPGSTSIPPRKLAATVLLSDQFEGGEFFFQYGRYEQIVEFTLGTMLLFPSTLLHGVKPIKSGVRHSLTQWVSGPTWT